MCRVFCRVYEHLKIIGSLHSLIWCEPVLGHALRQYLCLQGSWKGKSAIIGFFWAKAAECDFVMVTRAGLEIYTLAADRQVCTQCFCQCALIPMIGVPLPGQGNVCREYQLGWDLLVSKQPSMEQGTELRARETNSAVCLAHVHVPFGACRQCISEASCSTRSSGGATPTRAALCC